MTSTRKSESNKRNASRSTGPRTPGGKLRSRTNARRHGLATPVEHDSEARGRIEYLTAILAEGSHDCERIEQSRILAACHLDLHRIRSARYEVFLTIDNLENASCNDLETAMRAMDKINQYERRALSKRRRALRKSEAC
jgi:hypothetical protein